uniref:Uncharacterized protein n=2 Tax=Guillardia theta TaxID=55529 RepID=A0A7S4H8T4_GUITH|mmetsp:Transcript_10535/g.35218  ORF Transcript_10535/g.35218 Transcript_10535/m.35218 type:complete len:295 (+) Transcript_10535:579-1463(+)
MYDAVDNPTQQEAPQGSNQAGTEEEGAGYVDNRDHRQQFSADALSQDDTKPEGDEELPFGPFVNAHQNVNVNDLVNNGMLGAGKQKKDLLVRSREPAPALHKRMISSFKACFPCFGPHSQMLDDDILNPGHTVAKMRKQPGRAGENKQQHEAKTPEREMSNAAADLNISPGFDGNSYRHLLDSSISSPYQQINSQAMLMYQAKSPPRLEAKVEDLTSEGIEHESKHVNTSAFFNSVVPSRNQGVDEIQNKAQDEMDQVANQWSKVMILSRNSNAYKGLQIATADNRSVAIGVQC